MHMKSIKNITLIGILLLSIGYVHAQNEIRSEKSSVDFELGEEYFQRYAYRIAIKYFLKAYAEDTVSNAIKLRLAQSCYNMRDLEDAEYWANKVISGGYPVNADQVYHYVEILASRKKYVAANYWYNKYLTMDSVNVDRIKRMQGFLQPAGVSGVGSDRHVHQLEFNSDQRDFAPCYYKDGIVFVSGRPSALNIKKWFKNDGVDFLNLYYAQATDSGFAKPKIFSRKINSPYHEGPLAFYDNDTKLMFTQSSTVKRRLFGKKTGRNSDNITVLKLYMADIEDDHIKNIRAFEYNSNEFSTGHPTVSRDGQRLIFSSDRPDGKGGSDLFLCYRINDAWSPPKSLGDLINTGEQELFPYLDDNVLYFASDGRPGTGGLDIYYTVLVNDMPTEIYPLTYPINSVDDDFGLISKDGQVGYFASNRGNAADDNIFYAYPYKHKPKLTADIALYDTLTNQIITDTKVDLIDQASGNFLVPLKVKGDSLHTFVIESKRAYQVVGKSKGYYSQRFINSGTQATEGQLKWKYKLLPITSNKGFRLNDIEFDFDQSSLKDTSLFQLNNIVKWMENNPSIKIEISAHTDNRGAEGYNLKLSQRRAQSVAHYLIESGIDSSRIAAKGCGETKPIVPCPKPDDCTEEQHQINRRTELKVINN